VTKEVALTTINPALLYGGNAEDALDYYRSIFSDSEVIDESRYGDGAPMPAGTLLAATLRLGNQRFTLINGYEAGFTDSVSFMVSCADQAEVDYFWDALTKDGEESRCGWLRDRFGMAWQIVPERMGALMSDPDPVRAQAAMQAMMTMRKIVVADLERAADEAAASAS
jgi:predicted 3-demethylubiquinone-9 3-methyltransferase (glyoxalase superfamily)